MLSDFGECRSLASVKNVVDELDVIIIMCQTVAKQRNIGGICGYTIIYRYAGLVESII